MSKQTLVEKSHEESVREYIRVVQAAEEAGRTCSPEGVETWHGFEVGQRVGEKPDGSGYGVGSVVAGGARVVVSRKEYPGHSGYLGGHAMVPWRDAHGHIWITDPHRLVKLPPKAVPPPQAREGSPLKLGAMLPAFADELAKWLDYERREYRWSLQTKLDLASQVHDLDVALRCRCGGYGDLGDYGTCDAFFTTAPPRRSWEGGAHGDYFDVFLRDSRSFVDLDVVDGKIVFVSPRGYRGCYKVMDAAFGKRSKKP